MVQWKSALNEDAPIIHFHMGGRVSGSLVTGQVGMLELIRERCILDVWSPQKNLRWQWNIVHQEWSCISCWKWGIFQCHVNFQGWTTESEFFTGAELLSDSYGSLGADPSWPPEGSVPRFHQGPSKVPARARHSSTKVLQVSWCLWFSGQIRLGLLKGSAEDSAKVFTEVPPKVAQVSWSLWPTGAHPFWGPSLLFFLAFFPNSVSFEVFSHNKGLGLTSLLRFWWFFGNNSHLWRVLPIINSHLVSQML